MATKVFNGVNVFLSRNLVPPELFDALHDALKLNGAAVFLCCDPTRNGPSDYHVIASPEHEKFEDLRSKGCKLLGPQCLLSCAKENRMLPNQGYTCCLAMDGVNILASGFEKEEKADIAKMVIAMGGTLLTKASLDVSFVVAKNVLAQKYKWALYNVKKPIVTINWLLQCWKEHHLVPQELYRVLPFAGLVICVSGIPADERKEMEKLIVQNGGRYSAELTKSCTHLVCVATASDKYKVAKRWGHIHIVTRRWFQQCVARRGRLSEESYPVQGVSTLKTVEQLSQGRSIRYSQNAPSYLPTASDSESIFSAQAMDHDQENILPHPSLTSMDVPPLSTEWNDSPADQQKDDSTFDQSVANDSQSEDDDLYLSECRILLVGFDASRMRTLVDMVRRGGGSRYMSFSEKLTHVVVGSPSENETREVRSLAALGVIYVVKTTWLEECNRQGKEVPVLQRHIAYDILLPKDPVFFNKATTTSMAGVKQGKPSMVQPLVNNNSHENKNPQSEVFFTKATTSMAGGEQGKSFAAWPRDNNNAHENKNPQCDVLIGVKEDTILKVQSGLSNEIQHIKSSTVFREKQFHFSSTFPEEQRPEIVQWVNEGGGEVVVDQKENNVHFTVERHGVMPCLRNSARSTYVSSHWIHSCLKDGSLLDVGSHILYSPLPCHIPLPGLEGYRFCVSRYDLKERQLLRNLCYVLGVKFIEKLSKKVTHLFCKFAAGDKYEAAGRYGIHIVTAEWIYECVKQNKVVDLKGFYPKDLTSEDREAGLCSFSQYPTQSIRMASGDDTSHCLSQSQIFSNMQTVTSAGSMRRDQDKCSSNYSKRAKLLEEDGMEHSRLLDSSKDKSVNRNTDPIEDNATENTKQVSSGVPDVASAIEDLLAQTSKIQDQKLQESSGCHKNFMSSNTTILGQRHADPRSDPGPSEAWTNRSDKKEDNPAVTAGAKELFDSFSETQTDSQVVGYEEDLSGRQMIIDRVRSSNTSTRTADY